MSRGGKIGGQGAADDSGAYAVCASWVASVAVMFGLELERRRGRAGSAAAEEEEEEEEKGGVDVVREKRGSRTVDGDDDDDEEFDRRST